MFHEYGWSSLSSVRHLCTCEQNIDSHMIRRRLSVNTFSLSTTAELFGVVGVPSVVVVNSDGKSLLNKEEWAFPRNDFLLEQVS